MKTRNIVTALAGLTWLALLGPALADALEDCAHMLRHTGVPTHTRSTDLEVPLCRKGYVLSYNTWHRVPTWVLEVLTVDRFVKNVDREDFEFREDEEVGDKSARLEDYKGSKHDRGHMAPAGDMVWDQEAMEQSFLLTNMAPQIGVGFNRHIWKYLEEYARDLVPGREPLIVITGPVFDEGGTGIRLGKKVEKEPPDKDDSVTIPTAFFKIIFHPARKRAIAFLLSHQKLSGQRFEEFIVSIDEIEEATGIDFLNALSRREQNRIERIKALKWRTFEGS